MRRLDLNTVNLFSVIFEFSILRVKIVKLLKIWIFKHNSALNYSTVKKFNMKELELNTHTHTKKKNTYLAIFEFFNLTGKIDKSRKNLDFRTQFRSRYYFSVRKFHVNRIGMNIKNCFRGFLNFQLKKKRGVDSKISTFKKIQIFKHN